MSQTDGMYKVGIDFNPGGNPDVDHIKRSAASLIDYIQAAVGEGRSEKNRCAAIACTGIEEAAMWAVKAVTKPEREE